MRTQCAALALFCLLTAPAAFAQSAEEFAANGEIWLNKGDYRRAIDDLSRAAEAGREKTPAKVYLLRARAYAALKQFRWAEQDYQKAIEIDPDNREARQEMEKWAREGRMSAPPPGGRREVLSPPPTATPPVSPAPAKPPTVPAPAPPVSV